jgi:hypothetical protein
MNTVNGINSCFQKSEAMKPFKLVGYFRRAALAKQALDSKASSASSKTNKIK